MHAAHRCELLALCSVHTPHCHCPSGRPLPPEPPEEKSAAAASFMALAALSLPSAFALPFALVVGFPAAWGRLVPSAARPEVVGFPAMSGGSSSPISPSLSALLPDCCRHQGRRDGHYQSGVICKTK
eukprot:8464273-Pyramimonas_sp.AAC.1